MKSYWEFYKFVYLHTCIMMWIGNVKMSFGLGYMIMKMMICMYLKILLTQPWKLLLFKNIFVFSAWNRINNIANEVDMLAVNMYLLTPRGITGVMYVTCYVTWLDLYRCTVIQITEGTLWVKIRSNKIIFDNNWVKWGLCGCGVGKIIRIIWLSFNLECNPVFGIV